MPPPAHVVHHARHAMRGDVTRPGRRHQGRLVDVLIVEFGVDRRLAGEHHHRQAAAAAALRAVVPQVIN
jgi:hypothetical protein